MSPSSVLLPIPAVIQALFLCVLSGRTSGISRLVGDQVEEGRAGDRKSSRRAIRRRGEKVAAGSPSAKETISYAKKEAEERQLLLFVSLSLCFLPPPGLPD